MNRIDKSWLYNRMDECVICHHARGDHREECPGQIIDAVRLEVSFSSQNCPNGYGCCGGNSGIYRVDNVDEAITLVAQDCMEAVKVSARTQWSCTIGYVDAEVMAEIQRRKDAKRAEEEAEEARERMVARRAERDRSYAALEEEKGELFPDAYLRRREALAATYADVVDE